MKIIEHFSIEEIQRKLNESKSFREFLIKIGSSTNGSGSYKSVKGQLVNLGIEIPIFNYSNNKIRNKLKDSEVFIKDSTYSRQHLKERIIKKDLIKYECSKCGNKGKWNGKLLSLHLEHINGINNDNRLENLTFLCPNCHSQTDTYAGKKKRKQKKKCECGVEIYKTSKMCFDCNSKKSRKVERPSYTQIISDIEEIGYCGTGRKYNVCDNTIRKWIKNYTKL